jgi:hypothetical protein
VGHFGSQPVVELARIRERGAGNRRGHSIDYRHVIEGLHRKPRAFLHCVWQEELLPNEDYKAIWAQLKSQFPLDDAARLIVEALYLAATQNQETAVAQYLQQELAVQTLTLHRLTQHFAVPEVTHLPQVTVTQHALSSYDDLITPNLSPAPDTRLEPLSEPDSATQETQPDPHARPVGIYRASSYTATVVLCQILAGIVPPRSRPQRIAASPKSARRSPTSHKKFHQL